MQEMIDYKEDITKCSNCGLCQTVCPVYKITKDECALSRGKFIILKGVLKNELKLNKNIIKKIDICLNCNACKEFCPSGINAVEIFSTVKNSFNSSENFINKFLYSQSTFNLKMNVIKLFITIYRFLFLDKFIELSYRFLLKFGFIGKKIVFINSIIKINTKRKKISSNKVQNKKILFFEGCFNKYINPGSKNATLNILEELGYEPLKLNLGCCGITNYYSGHFKEFQKQANNIINKIPRDIEAIVCDCDSCLNVLKNYNKYFKDAEFIEKKAISLSEFLIINGYNKTSQKNHAITYHKPCHGDMSAEEMIKKLNNIAYKPIKHQSCCGFAGEFAFKYYKLSEEISKNKAEEILNTEAQIILTSCPSCIMGLQQGLIQKNEIKTVFNISEFLDKI